VRRRIRLRPLRNDEVPAFLERGQQAYARDMAANGGLSEEAATRKAERDAARLFPSGKPQDGHFLYVLEIETGEPAGRLWWAVEDRDGDRIAFLYDIYLEERFRGEGLGREAMALLEDDVRSRGLARIQLNVFGGNERARALYRSLGYAEQAVTMGKPLGPGLQ
jgi:ribosomal protein S18 acetylase RimI-like enzyme